MIKELFDITVTLIFFNIISPFELHKVFVRWDTTHKVTKTKPVYLIYGLHLKINESQQRIYNFFFAKIMVLNFMYMKSSTCFICLLITLR